MRYATTAKNGNELHRQDNGATRGYCKKYALHVVDADAASYGLATRAMRTCKSCDRIAGERRRAELSLADSLFVAEIAPAPRKRAAVAVPLFDDAPALF